MVGELQCMLKAKSMFPVDLFLPTIHLSCMFPLGVRKYLSTTSSIADATKENKNKGREDIREEEGRRNKERNRGKTNPYSIQGQLSAICCLALLDVLRSS